MIELNKIPGAPKASTDEAVEECSSQQIYEINMKGDVKKEEENIKDQPPFTYMIHV